MKKKPILLAALFVLLIPLDVPAQVSDCYDHYNHSAWNDQGLAIVLCRNSPDLDSCEIRRHGAERLQGLTKHGALDNGNSWEDGCCRNLEYGPDACCDVGGDPPCEDPDYQDPPVGTPGGPACPPLRSRTYSDGSQLLDVEQCSETRLTFQIDQVPDPANLSYAELTMELTDSDHPNEEGTVWINDQGPLQLPARTEWDDQTAPATIPLPLSYLVSGTNTVKFGAGPRTRTYYIVNLLALQVEGPACQTDPEPDPGGEDAGGGDDASIGDDAGAGDDAQAGDDSIVGDDAGTEPDEDTGNGDGCSCGSNSRHSVWGLLLVMLLFAFRRRAA